MVGMLSFVNSTPQAGDAWAEGPPHVAVVKSWSSSLTNGGKRWRTVAAPNRAVERTDD